MSRRGSAALLVLAASIAVLLSAMMAYGFARYRFPGREWLFRILNSSELNPEALEWVLR